MQSINFAKDVQWLKTNPALDHPRVLELVEKIATHIRLTMQDESYFRFRKAEYHERSVGGQSVLTRDGFPVEKTSDKKVVAAFCDDLRAGLLEEFEINIGTEAGSYPPW